MHIENIMQKYFYLINNLINRICALAVIGSMAETRMHGTVYTKIDYSTLWACVRLVIYQIIIR